MLKQRQGTDFIKWLCPQQGDLCGDHEGGPRSGYGLIFRRAGKVAAAVEWGAAPWDAVAFSVMTEKQAAEISPRSRCCRLRFMVRRKGERPL